MDNQLFPLADVARILGRNPHQVVYALTTRHVAEPALRVANKRVFAIEDVDRLARHFRVTPNWQAVESPANGLEYRPTDGGLVLTPPFSVQSAGETGHEVRDGDGIIFAWASDRPKALVIAGLLESAIRR